jgi:hypothetical protein
MKVWVVKGLYEYDESRDIILLKICSTEEKANSFKNEYDNNPEIQLVKELYKRWLYGGDEIYYDDNSPEPIVIGYVEHLTEEERLIFATYSFEKKQEYKHFDHSFVEEWEVD